MVELSSSDVLVILWWCSWFMLYTSDESAVTAPPLQSRSKGKAAFRWPLRLLLTVPIILPVVVAGAVVGWLSWRSGQMAVQHLAQQLMTQVRDRTQQQLSDYMLLPPRLAARVAQDAEQGRIQLDGQNLQALDAYFLDKSWAFPEVSFVYAGTSQGHFIGAGFLDRQAQPPLQLLEVADRSTQGRYISYAVQANGQRGNLLEQLPRYDARQQPWYQAAIMAQQPTWTAMYLAIGQPQPGLTITAVHPVRRQGKIAGVAAADFFVRDIARYLQKMRFSEAGQILILEPDGKLVATSFEQPVYQMVAGQPQRLNAYTHPDPVIRGAMTHLRGQLPLNQAQRRHIAGQARYVQMTPWQAAGLNWQIVVILPESEFTAQIQRNNWTTCLLSGMALLVAAGLSYWMAQRVTRPILRLSQAAREVAHGQRRTIALPQRTPELEDLTDSVNHMASRLQRSLSSLHSLNQALFDSKQRLYQVMEALPVGVVVIDPTGKCLYLNRTGQLLLGLKQIPQVSLAQLPQAFRLYRAATQQLYPWSALPVAQALQGKAVYVDDLEVRLPNTVIPLEARAIPVADAAGRVAYAIQTFQNISARKQAEQAQAQSEQRIQKLTDNVPGVIFRYVIDAAGHDRYAYVSPHAAATLGVSAAELQRDPQVFWSMVFPEDEVTIRRLLPQKSQTLQPWTVEYRVRLANGQVKWLQTQASPERTAAGEVVWDGLTLDITERKHAEMVLYDYRQHLEQQVQERTIALQQANQALERLATLDGLTQVANRRRFDLYLEQEWQRLARDQQPLSLILCDVDYFKRYNDRYGHPAGDRCLQQVAAVMQSLIKRPADLLARYGGEEFAVILPQTNRWGAAQVAELMRSAVQQEQITHADSPISDYVSMSVGVATMFPTLEADAGQLVAAADEALYQAKQQGRDRVCFVVSPSPPEVPEAI